jgi:dipeptidyl aminopeptidase/acylaminoacyl peptidase
MRSWSSTLLLVSILSLTLVAAAQDSSTDSLKPAAITAMHVPVIPKELAENLRRFQHVRGAGFLAWSPDGKSMLIRTRFANTSQLHVVPFPGGRREQITFFDEPIGGATFIPKADDAGIMFSMGTGGNENNQVYFFDRAMFKQTLLTDGKSKHGFGPFSPDGRKVVISSNERNGRDTDLLVASVRDPADRKTVLEVEKQFWNAADWSPDGTTLLISRFVSATESHPALLDLATGAKTELPEASDSPAGYGPLAFAADGKSLWIATDAQGEFRQLARFDLAEKKYDFVTSDIPWDVEDVAISKETGTVAFTINDDGANKLFVLEGKGAQWKRRELKVPLGLVANLDFSPDGKQLGLTLARAEAPPDAYSIDIATGELKRWTYSEMGGLNPVNFVVPERIRVKSFDQLEIPAYCFRPKTASLDKKAPVLITIHGGPESQYQPSFSPITQHYVSEMGIAVIAPNVRGSSGYGKTYLKRDNVKLREDSVKDIGAILDWIATQPDLDASRVAVHGGSYGGYMVLASLTNYPDRIKAGVDIVGIANFITFLEKTAAYRQDLRRVEYGDERDPDVRAFLEKISPTTNVHKIRSALLVIHGENDPRVPVGEARQIAAAVEAKELSVWSVIANNEGHGFSQKDNNDYARAVEAMFLRKHLLEDAAGK